MPIELSRRQLLASAGAASLASLALPVSVRNLLSGAPADDLAAIARRAKPLSEIKHVVVLMQENRSFDHYFGAMPGVRGFSEKGVPASRWKQIDPDNPDGYLLPFHANTKTTSAQALPSNSHSWGPQHDSWNHGQMDMFVKSRLEDDGDDAQYSMAYYKRDDIPFHWALADAFTICDGYHCSIMGPTWPNRLYLMTGQIDPEGGKGGPVWENDVPSEGFEWETYPEMLTKHDVSWKVYQEVDNYGMNMLEYFDKFQNASPTSTNYKSGMRFYQAGQFEYDALHDRLPTVSYIIPTSYQSEHPDFMPAAGADFVASKIAAIAANEDVWNKTVFVLVYDENDGYFDHVTPPTPPQGTKGEWINVDGYGDAPIGLGFRVPCIIVSPWTVGGYVCHDTFDHTSVTRLLESVTGVRNRNITSWRRKTAGDLSTALASNRSTRVPRLPSTAKQLVAAEEEVLRFDLPAFPGKDQTMPTQGKGHKPVRQILSAVEGA